MNSNQIILIGGAPTTGKSTVAAGLAKHFGISWISTDQVREIMKGTVTKQERPMLFRSRTYTAEEFLTKFSVDEIVQNEIDESEAVWEGTRAFINEDWMWHTFIVEGVAILPHLIAKEYKDNPRIKPVFLIDEDADRIRDVVWTRGLWDDAKLYPDNVKEKEVEWVLKFNKYLKVEADKYGFPTVEVSKGDTDISAVLAVLT